MPTGALPRAWGESIRKLVLVGAGHAHVQVLARFGKDAPADTRVTLVVDQPTLIYSGMLPGFVGGQYRLRDIEIDVLALARLAGVDVRLARAVAVDPASKRIALHDGSHVSYDVASFNVGGAAAGSAIPGLTEHAVLVRPMMGFVRAIDHLVELAQTRNAATPFAVTIVGAGAGGVELSFALQHRLHRRARIPAKVTLLEAGPSILAGYPNAFVSRIHRRAATRHIEIRCGCTVTAVHHDAVVLANDSQVPHDTVVWATGVTGQPLFRQSSLSTDRSGFVRVRPTLQVEEAGDLFAAGDCASLVGYPMTPKAGVFPVHQAPTLIHNLGATLAGQPLRRYTPQRDFLTLLNLSDGTAIGCKWRRTIEGRWVMKLKDLIDRRFVHRFRTSNPSGPSVSHTAPT